MQLTLPRFVLLLVLSATGLAACGGGGGGSSALPPAAAATAAAASHGQAQTATPTPAPAATPTGAPAYTGVVSGIGLGSVQGFTANCNNTNNFNQGFSCIPVTTTGATIVGSETVGAYFELWGTVNPPNVTATYVIFAATPFPSPTPTGAASPTPVPTVAPVSTITPVPLANGVAWPASFQPYAGSPIWSTPVESNPSYDPNSAAIIAAWFPGAGNGFPVRNQEPGPYDYTHPIYFAAGTDPTIHVACSGGSCVTGGANAYATSMQIPATAHPAESNGNGAGDSHIGVVQPNGTENDVYCWNSGGSPTCDQPGGSAGNTWSAGATMQTASGADSCGSFYSGTGQLPSTVSGNTTAGAACEGAGLLSPQQLLAGHINHALFLIVNCANGNEYPAESSSNTNACSGTGPALGARLWYDVPDATTNASTTLQPWEKAILNALHDYGGYVMDDVNGGPISAGIEFVPESEEPAYRYGSGDQWSALAAQGWTSASIPGAPANYKRWFGGDQDANGNWAPSGVNLNAHLHVLSVCVTQRAC